MRPVRDQLHSAHPLRVSLDHERLADDHARAVARRDQFARFGRVHADGLLAQHMLPCFGGADGPRHMQVIRQRIVDRVDIGVRQQFLVGAVGAGNARDRARPVLPWRESREAMAAISHELALLHGRNHFGVAMRATPSTPQRSC